MRAGIDPAAVHCAQCNITGERSTRATCTSRWKVVLWRGVTLTAELDSIELHAADIDPAAARCAQRNITGGGPPG